LTKGRAEIRICVISRGQRSALNGRLPQNEGTEADMVKLGAALLVVGISIAAGYLIYWFVAEAVESMPGPLKGAVIAAAIGFLLLLLAVIRDRLKSSKEEEELKGVKQ
jgi:hypothetical protein